MNELDNFYTENKNYSNKLFREELWAKMLEQNSFNPTPIIPGPEYKERAGEPEAQRFKDKIINKPAYRGAHLENLLTEVWEGIKATPETALTLATGAMAWPISIVGGIGATIGAGAKTGREFEQFLQEYYTYQPKGKTAQEASEIVGNIYEKLLRGAKWVSEISEKLGATPEGQFYVEKVGEVATLFALPKIIPGIKKIISKPQPWEKPATISDIATLESELQMEKDAAKFRKEKRTPGDIAAELEKEKMEIETRRAENIKVMEDLNKRAKVEVEEALNKISPEEWAKYEETNKAINMEEMAGVIRRGIDRLEDSAKEQPNLPDIYKKIIEKEKEELKTRAENLDRIAKEANNIGEEILVVPQVLTPKPQKKGYIATLRSWKDIAIDLRTILKLDERGAVGDLGSLSGEKLGAYNRLRKDFSDIIRNAQRTGKTIENYLSDLGFDKDVIQYMVKKYQITQQEKEKITQQPRIYKPSLDIEMENVRINLDRIIATDDVKNIIADLDQKLIEDKKIAQHRKTVTHEETETKAQKISASSLLSLPNDTATLAPRITALRNEVNRAATYLDELVEKADSGNINAKGNLLPTSIIVAELIKKQEIASRNIARSLEAHKIMSEAEAGGKIDLTRLNEVVEKIRTARDEIGPEYLLQLLKTLKLPEQKSHFLSKIGSALSLTKALFNEAWIAGLLTVPASHVANILGSFITIPIAIGERAVAAQIGKIGHKKGEMRVVPGEASIMIESINQGLSDAFRMAAKAWETGESAFKTSKLDVSRSRTWSSQNIGIDPTSAIGLTIDFIGNSIIQPIFKGLLTADEFFKATNNRMQLKALSLREAVIESEKRNMVDISKRAEELFNNPTESMLADAKNFANYQTYSQELGKIGKMAQEIVEVVPGLKQIFPFLKTPTNIFKYNWERTPVLQFISTKMWQDIIAGGARQDLALARVGTAAGFLALTWILFEKDLITGAGPLSPELNKLWRKDKQEYSFKIGKNYYSYNRFDVPGNIIGFIADLMTMRRDIDIDSWDKAASAVILALANMFRSKTYLQGLSNVIEAIRDPETKGMKYIEKWSASLVPAGIAAINRIIDPEMKEIDGILETLKSRTPYFSKDLFSKRDFYGEPTLASEHPILGLAFPMKIKKIEDDPVIEEILRNQIKIESPQKYIFGSKPSEDPLRPERLVWGIPLTPQQHSRYVKLMRKEPGSDGKTFREYLLDLIQSPHYQEQSGGPDGGRALLIRTYINKRQEEAKIKLLNEFPGLKEEYDEKTRKKIEALRPTK